MEVHSCEYTGIRMYVSYMGKDEDYLCVCVVSVDLLQV